MKNVSKIFAVTMILALLLAGCNGIPNETEIPPPETEEIEIPPEEEVETEPPPICESKLIVNFETQAVGTQFIVGDWFEENSVIVSFEPFIRSDGTPTADGQAEITASGDAGGSGNELWLNNINARFIFPCPIEGLSLRFGEYGGNLNIEINGEFKNFEDFFEIDGTVIGGVDVSVPMGGFGNDQGLLELKGEIYSFSIGGQELVIDDVCPWTLECDEIVCLERCVDFEEQSVGDHYIVFDWFVENDVIVSFAPFIWGDGTPTVDGYGEIVAEGLAGGSGNELWLNNINARFVFPCPIGRLSLLFGEYGGNINVEVNGEHANVDNFTDLPPIMGGVDVFVEDFGDGLGELVLEGEIHSFSIGGQELWIDDVCTY